MTQEETAVAELKAASASLVLAMAAATGRQLNRRLSVLKSEVQLR
jgi:hypothetical protein